jgi:hypothetical protein
MSCLLLTSLFVQSVFQQNAFHEKREQIHQILRQTKTKGGDPVWSKRVTGLRAETLLTLCNAIKNKSRCSQRNGFTV